MSQTHTRRTVLRGIGAGTALLVGGVGAATAEGSAGLRVAHASPNAPDVDVLVDGDAAVEGLSFRSVTDYLELDAGEYEVAVEPAGGGDPVFGPTTVELEAEDYTAVARGEVGDADTAFTVDLLVDTNGANIGDDEARVRAYHASPDAPAVDVTYNGGTLLFDGVERFTSSGYAVVPAGDYDVEIRPDTEENDGEVVNTPVPTVTLEGRSTYTVFAIGYLSPDDDPSDEAFRLLPSLDAGAPPRGDDDEDEDEEEEEEEDEEEEEEEEEE